MTEEQTERLVQMNERLLLVLGFGTSLVLQMNKFIPIGCSDDIYVLWFIQAVENIVYLDKPLPPMP